MTDMLNVNGNLYEGSSPTDEFNKGPGGDMVPFYEEVTVMKTEIKQELYDIEMSVDDMEHINIKEEVTFSPETIFEEENLGCVTNTQQLLNENLVVGSCEIKEEDLQNNKYRCPLCHSEFEEEVYLRSHYEQCFLAAKKKISKSLNVGETYECAHCTYLTPVRESFLTHIAVHKGHTDSRANVAQHMQVHANDKPFKCIYKNCKCTPGQKEFCECNTCGFAFKNKGSLNRHILTKHSTEPKKYKCSSCKYATHIKAYLLAHNRTHTGEKFFKCTYKDCKCTPGQEQFCECITCGFAFTSSTVLKHHILTKHSTEPKKYQCSKCKYATHIKVNLVKHNRIHTGHTGEKAFKCPYKNCKCTPGQEEFCECNTCEFASNNKSSLNCHILTKHSTETKKYKCSSCKYATHIKAHLVTHNHIHTGEKSFKCTYKDCKCTPGQEQLCECNTCEFAFTNITDLKRHILTKHSAEPKKYKCSNCKYATHDKQSLVKHNRIHTDEKPYKCTYKNCKCTPGQEELCECNTCGFAFTSSNGLKGHILVKHSAEPKKYKCSHCKFATYFKATLVRHNNIHTGEKAFKCTYKNCKCSPEQEQFCQCNTCEFASARNSNLKQHILLKHSIEQKY